MRLRQFLIALAVGAALGGLVFLISESRIIDIEAAESTQQALKDLRQLDTEFNEEILKYRLNLDPDSTELLDLLPVVAEAPKRIMEGENKILGINAELDQAVARYNDIVQKKVAIAEEYEKENLALVYSLEDFPYKSDFLLAELDPEEWGKFRTHILRMNKEVLTYGMLQDPPNEELVDNLLIDFGQMMTNGPEGQLEPMLELVSLGNSILANKKAIQQRLDQLLSAPVQDQLGKIEALYLDWYENSVTEARRYRTVLIGYSIMLLVILAYLAYRLRNSFRDLDRANAELQNTNEHLEEMVAERTKDLESTLSELKESQSQLIQSEKMASLGQMVAGVAHEINTPLGYVRSNTEILGSSLAEVEQLTKSYQEVFSALNNPEASEQDIAQAAQDLQSLEQDLQPSDMFEELRQLLVDNDHGLRQITELVGSLKDFSRLDRAKTDQFNVHDGLESTLKIAQNQIKDRITVERQFKDIPTIECSPSQINQVFLNIINNASQAIEGEGTITIATEAAGDHVIVRIRDTGCGMDEETRKRIFDPFYTTKPVGQGTGLGLSIVFRIIEEHGGRINVKSAPGQGTEFVVALPVKQKQSAAQEQLDAVPA
ncbi:MAG: DAHL domain-containing protein [Salinisphaeraceae bacterium]|nr:DAHL domain-containing protein [Salinisphaeraceae bacterium]